MKPFGLPDPRTGREPYAAVQLRQDNLARSHYNLVGFQTKLKVGEQRRIFRSLPGLANAEFVRYGMLHRNTFLNGPAHLDRFFRWKKDPRVFFAGQITGVEGYLESAATGLMAGATLAQLLEGREPQPLPFSTALGALVAPRLGERRGALRPDERDLRPDRRLGRPADPGPGEAPGGDRPPRARVGRRLARRGASAPRCRPSRSRPHKEDPR